MATLADLKAKYKLGDGAKYDPKPNCAKCRGDGEWVARSGETRFCICLFVSHDMSDVAGEILAKVAKDIRKTEIG